MTTNERIEKLPKWAQKTISKLEADKAAAEERARIICGKNPDARIFSGLRELDSIPLPDRLIRFEIDDRHRFDVIFKDDYLEVRCAGHWLQDLAIIPSSSNCAHIHMLRRDKKLLGAEPEVAKGDDAFPDNITLGDKYGPAMEITDQAEADAYFEKCVAHTMRYGTVTRQDAENIERVNLGYYAGYYDHETMKRVQELFGAAHPIFGRTER